VHVGSFAELALSKLNRLRRRADALANRLLNRAGAKLSDEGGPRNGEATGDRTGAANLSPNFSRTEWSVGAPFGPFF